MKQINGLLLLLFAMLIYACGSDKDKANTQAAPTQPSSSHEQTEVQKEENIPTSSVKEPESPYSDKRLENEIMAPYDQRWFSDYYGERVLPPEFNLDVDLTGRKLGDLRILRNEIFARKGYHFSDGFLRGYFQGKEWYQPPWWEENYPVELTPEENAFVARVKKEEDRLIKENFVDKGGLEIPNMDNVVNLEQFRYLSDNIYNGLAEKGFCIVPNDNIQLFHIYEQNDYEQLPSFITTDLFLQVYHMYFLFVLRELEVNEFIPSLIQMLNSMMKEAEQTTCAECQPYLDFSSTYYAVALELLTGKPMQVSAYAAEKEEDLAKIVSASGRGSALLKDEFHL